MRTVIACLIAASVIRPAFADPKVVTDILAVEALVAEVLGEKGDVSVLVEQGADPHSYALRPSQAAAVESADLAVWIGPELTPWMERVLDTAISAQRLGLLDVAGTHLLEYGEDHDDHEHEEHADHDDHKHDDHAHEAKHEDDHDDHGHEDHADHGDHDHEEHADHDDHKHEEHAGHDDHDHSGVDPHAWLDPHNAEIWLTAIAEALGEINPEAAETYAQNASNAAERIEALEAEVAKKLAGAADKPIVVFHDAYSYFSHAFEVSIAGSIALGDAAAPGAARVTQLREMIDHDGVTCIYREPQHSPKLAEQIAADTGARLGTLDPHGALLEAGPDFYGRLVNGLADDLLSCLNADS